MRARRPLLAASLLALLAPSFALADDLPPFDKVSEGYEKVVSTADGDKPFYTVWKNDKDAQLLAELPPSFEGREFFLVPTVAGGHPQTGVYSIWHNAVGIPSRQVYWKRYGDQLALVEPNLYIRSSGDQESEAAVDRVSTDSIVLTTKVVANGPGGGPVIDLDAVLLDNSSKFFGRLTRGANLRLREITKAKAFPYNLEIAFEFPRANGQLTTIHYSLGQAPKTAAYKPREADRRVGIYYVDFVDRAKNDGESQKKRYVTRWHIEKADPSLRVSPPKQPIVYYIEHTTPIRYRRWVRDGILAWNRAFEQVGIVNAIEVRQQDARTGAHMDKDPEDIRYSFVRWTNANMGFAIGPVHAHPDTGEIFEADVVMDEGFLSSWADAYLQAQLASVAMAAIDPALHDWLVENPEWDPRYRLAAPENRSAVQRYQRALAEGNAEGLEPPPTMLPEVWEPHADAHQPGRLCRYQPGKGVDVAIMRMAQDVGMPLDSDGEGENGEGEDQESMLDGLPEDFVGPLLKDVIMHEVGHTMGLMHNWKGSMAYEFDEINSEEFKGKKPICSTVMDYTATNIVVEDGQLIQGDYAPIDIGPYDMWAIEWAYTFDDPAKVAKRSAEPGHAFTAEDGQFSPDPQAKVWDLGKNSLDHAEARATLASHVRGRILEKGVEDGDSWEKARDLFSGTVYLRFAAIAESANWVGGAHISKSKKGDPGAPDPIRPVDVEEQRRALRFIVENAFRDESWGLTPEILTKLGSDNWYDEGYSTPHDWPVHDQILALQAATMSMLINPTKLRRVQDNELRVASGEDALTVPEVLKAIRKSVWSELAEPRRAEYTNREPLVSSLRRNLQAEHVNRLISLARGMPWPGASGRDLANLARQELRDVSSLIENARRVKVDDYTRAHLSDVDTRIDRALEATYLQMR